MAMDTAKRPVKGFRGLNNVVDPMRLSLDSLVQADNVNITQTASLVRCEGFTQRTTNFAVTGAYATKDLQRMYMIDTGELRKMNTDLTHTVVKTGLSANRTWFEEVNNVVYYANGIDYGVIEPTGWRQWGIQEPSLPPNLTMTNGNLPQGTYQVTCTYTDSRGLESGNSDVAVITGSGQVTISNIPQQAGYTTNVYVTMHDGTVFFLLKAGAGTSASHNSEANLGVELPYWGASIPRGTVLAHFEGQLYIAEAYPQNDLTAIWISLPLQFHHFDYSSGGITVPGTVRMMKASKEALIIGTDRAIFAYDGEKLMDLAHYGVAEGWHASQLGDDLFFWSLRGLCSAMPFKNHTERTLSVAPGVSAGALVIEEDGLRRYVVAVRSGGSAYNRR